VNGNGLKMALALLGILGAINVALSGWALNSIVHLREDMAGQMVRVNAIEDNRFTERDGMELERRLDTHRHGGSK